MPGYNIIPRVYWHVGADSDWEQVVDATPWISEFDFGIKRKTRAHFTTNVEDPLQMLEQQLDYVQLRLSLEMPDNIPSWARIPFGHGRMILDWGAGDVREIDLLRQETMISRDEIYPAFSVSGRDARMAIPGRSWWTVVIEGAWTQDPPLIAPQFPRWWEKSQPPVFTQRKRVSEKSAKPLDRGRNK